MEVKRHEPVPTKTTTKISLKAKHTKEGNQVSCIHGPTPQCKKTWTAAKTASVLLWISLSDTRFSGYLRPYVIVTVSGLIQIILFHPSHLV